MRPDNLTDAADAQQLHEGKQSRPLLMHKGSVMFRCVLLFACRRTRGNIRVRRLTAGRRHFDVDGGHYRDNTGMGQFHQNLALPLHSG